MLFEDIFDENYIDPEVQDYINFMDADDQESTGFLTHKRVDAHFQEVGEALNYLIAYPDRLVDLMTPAASHFHLFFLQRIMMRCMRRGNASFHFFHTQFDLWFLLQSHYQHCIV